MVVAPFFAAFAMLPVFIASVDINSIKDLIDNPVNQLEFTDQYCADRWDREIPSSGNPCTTLLAVSDMEGSSVNSSFSKSRDKFISSLPTGLQTPMENRVQDFDHKFGSSCVKDYYCQFQMHGVLVAHRSKWMLAVCEPCDHRSEVIGRMFNLGERNFFWPAEGKMEFKYKLSFDQQKQASLRIISVKNEILLESTNNSVEIVDKTIYGVRMHFVVKEHKADVFTVTMTMNTYLVGTPNQTCTSEDIREERYYKGLPKQVVIEEEGCSEEPWPMMVASEHASKDVFWPSNLTAKDRFLNGDIGFYLTFCKFTYIILERTFQPVTVPLCGNVFFKNGSRNPEDHFHGIEILRPVDRVEFDKLMNKCNVLAIKVDASPSALHNHPYLHEHSTMIVCMCQPTLEERKCDLKWNMLKLDAQTMRGLGNNSCLSGSLNSTGGTVEGYIGFCTMTKEGFSYKEAVSDDGLCWDLDSKTDKKCDVIGTDCGCCCLAINGDACNLNFGKGGKWRYMYNICLETAKYGPYNLSNFNYRRLPRELPFGETVLIGEEDLLDTNHEFEQLLAFFRVSVLNMGIQEIGLFNPRSPVYTKNMTRIRVGGSYSMRKRVCSNVVEWKLDEMVTGCSCLATDEHDVFCCCSTAAVTDVIAMLSVELIVDSRDSSILNGLELAWAYRENLTIQRPNFNRTGTKSV